MKQVMQNYIAGDPSIKAAYTAKSQKGGWFFVISTAHTLSNKLINQ